MTHLRRGDRDLHDEHGEHIGTVPSPSDQPISGHAVALWEARIRRHLAEHRQRDLVSQQAVRPTDVETTEGRL
jgi:hypothetical protein